MHPQVTTLVIIDEAGTADTLSCGGLKVGDPRGLVRAVGHRTIPVRRRRVDHLGCLAVCWETEL
jgi:hypothetical protein